MACFLRKIPAMKWLSLIGVGVAVFASTNIDNLFLLLAFFADRQMRARNIILGQFAGIAFLVFLSTIIAFIIPQGWTALLGAVPLGLGLSKLRARRHGIETNEEQEATDAVHMAEARSHSQVLAVTSVTIANGGDNLSVYIPLFAGDPSAIPTYTATFAVMLALCCFAVYRVVNHRRIRNNIRYWGHKALPILLICIGFYTLSGARVLLG
jgi:cadmium resistance protein CadD (predicted permease)